MVYFIIGLGVVGAVAIVYIAISTTRITRMQQAWVDRLRFEGRRTTGVVSDLVQLRFPNDARTAVSMRISVSLPDEGGRVVQLDGIVPQLVTTTSLRIGAQIPIVVRGNDALVEAGHARTHRSLIGGSFPWMTQMIEGLHETK